ncbi:hypothetical protein SLEP1_g34677 [Rubroshorea leprosula]|uniref:Uncharacterized protein n=1 Tax=Rubroshorea leprosula TaxID=152421 RepID=A0AAV5KKR5_9ROSI|nr:hypothetical protein SLEP1_g34677 [Rubroshorea leprosula]
MSRSASLETQVRGVTARIARRGCGQHTLVCVGRAWSFLEACARPVVEVPTLKFYKGFWVSILGCSLEPS